jgi:hypothetical protein
LPAPDSPSTPAETTASSSGTSFDQLPLPPAVLANLDLRYFDVQALVGGSTMRPQLASLEHGAHVVMGTPGRTMGSKQRR